MMRESPLLAFVAGLALCACAGASEVDRYSEELRVHFIDVGQGDCVFVITPNDTIPGNGTREGLRILIDAGKPGRGEQYVIPYLAALGMEPGDTVDYVVATHPHNDHIGGMPEIYSTYQVDRTLDPGYFHTIPACTTFRRLADDEDGSRYYCDLVDSGLIAANGDTLDLGSELEVRVLYASPDGSPRLHDAQLVLRLQYGEVSFLFMGDADGKKRHQPDSVTDHVEEYLIDNYSAAELRSTVLKVGHHGSMTSSTKRFREAVRPECAIILSGRQRFDGVTLPDSCIVRSFLDLGARVWRTDEGDEEKDDEEAGGDDHIVATTDGHELSVEWRPRRD